MNRRMRLKLLPRTIFIGRAKSSGSLELFYKASLNWFFFFAKLRTLRQDFKSHKLGLQVTSLSCLKPKNYIVKFWYSCITNQPLHHRQHVNFSRWFSFWPKFSNRTFGKIVKLKDSLIVLVIWIEWWNILHFFEWRFMK